MNCEQVRLNLVAYLDDEVSEAERAEINAHLASCTDCAEALERMRALQAGLHEVVPAGLERMRLSRTAQQRIRSRLRQAREKRSPWEVFGGLLRPRPGLVKAAISLVVVLFVVATVLLGTQPLPVSAQEMVVVVPEGLAPDTDAALRVIVRQAGSTVPVADAEVRVRLRAPGKGDRVVYQGRTDEDGTADVRFRVPDYGEDELSADLIVTTEAAEGRSEIRQQVTLRRTFHLYLTSDKPLYQPGQTIYLRALAFEAARGLPAAARSLRFTVQDRDGLSICEQTVRTSSYGIASSACVLSPDASQGTYRLLAALGDTVSERTVTVGRYERPQYRVSLDMDRAYYLPNQLVVGKIAVSQFDETPIQGAQVAVRAYLDSGQQVLDAQGRTNASGVYGFSFSAPGAERIGERTNLRIEAAAADRDQATEWAGQVVPLAAEPLAIDVVAEGGKLRPGVPNRVYLLAAAPDGAPVPAQLDIGVAGRSLRLNADAYGLAEFDFTPAVDAREVPVQVRAADPEGRTVTRTVVLSTERGPAQVLLRLDRAAYEVGETMRMEVLTVGAIGEVVYLDVTHREGGQTLGTYLARLRDGRAQLEVDLSPEMAGTIEVHAYQVLADGTVARDARLAVVDAPSEVSVRMRTDRESYGPDDVALVTVDTAVDGTPVQSAIGVAVVDESVFALEERAPGFAKLYFLLEASLLDLSARPLGVTLPDLLDPPTARVREAQDLAARAAWAGIPGGTLRVERSVAPREQTPRWALPLSLALGVLLLCIPLALWGIVLERLKGAGLFGGALWRTAAFVVGGSFVLLIPAAAAAAILLRILLGRALGLALLALLGASWLATLLALAVEGWRRNDHSVQFAALLVGAYGILGALLGYTAERGADLGAALTWGVVALVLPALAALLLLAAGLWQERRRLGALLVILLVLLTVTIAVLSGLSIELQSRFSLILSDPQMYAGPVGWLAGCAAKTEGPQTQAKESVQETVVVEKEVEKEVTKVVEKEVEKVVTKVVEKEVVKEGTQTAEVAVTATPAAMATPTPALAEPGLTPVPAASPTPSPPPTASPPRPTATAVSAGEPRPPLLGQFVPETILWMPEAITDASGHMELEVGWPQASATWRITVLASTQRGELGTATTRISVVEP